LATWPSGKEGGCKSFFSGLNLGVALSTKENKIGIPLCFVEIT
jgi:hypothetical protein